MIHEVFDPPWPYLEWGGKFPAEIFTIISSLSKLNTFDWSLVHLCNCNLKVEKTFWMGIQVNQFYLTNVLLLKSHISIPLILVGSFQNLLKKSFGLVHQNIPAELNLMHKIFNPQINFSFLKFQYSTSTPCIHRFYLRRVYL